MPQPPRNIDLHLLECFDVLLRERSVSRAAEHLGVSQSSASEMLARLRERFGDPLLVRTREGLAPTPRAEELLPLVRSAIEELRRLLDDVAGFDPLTARTRFRITTSDFAQLLLMPQLMQRLRQEAPACSIDLLPVHVLGVEQALGAGDVDLAIAYFPEPPQGLRRSPLFTDPYTCVARAGHPAVGRSLTPQEFAQLAHIRVAPSGLTWFGGALDESLEALGLQRRIAVSSPQFLLAAHLVAQSDMVLLLPSRAAAALSGFLPLAAVQVPVPVQPLELSMYWHERSHQGKAHQWLRERVRAILAAQA